MSSERVRMRIPFIFSLYYIYTNFVLKVSSKLAT